MWWIGLVALAGLGFGLAFERRPLGDHALTHPLILFGIACGAGLLALRVVARRPVPEILPERVILIGFAFGVAMYVTGIFLAPLIGGR